MTPYDHACISYHRQRGCQGQDQEANKDDQIPFDPVMDQSVGDFFDRLWQHRVKDDQGHGHGQDKGDHSCGNQSHSNVARVIGLQQVAPGKADRKTFFFLFSLVSSSTATERESTLLQPEALCHDVIDGARPSPCR